MKVTRTFIGGKMNKDLDERLVPQGDYIHGLNVRTGNTELTESGALENSKGNNKLTTLTWAGQALSSDAKTIGSFASFSNTVA